jgi:hypothetical protein
MHRGPSSTIRLVLNAGVLYPSSSRGEGQDPVAATTAITGKTTSARVVGFYSTILFLFSLTRKKIYLHKDQGHVFKGDILRKTLNKQTQCHGLLRMSLYVL